MWTLKETKRIRRDEIDQEYWSIQSCGNDGDEVREIIFDSRNDEFIFRIWTRQRDK